MKTPDVRRYEMFVRVRDYGAAHRDAFPPGSLGGKMFVTVGHAVDALAAHATARAGGGTRQDTVSRAAVRAALRERLAQISQTARAAALDTPGLDDQFRVPRQCGDLRLLALARSFAQNARPLAKTFAAHDLPSTFLSRLQGEIEAFDQAIRDVGAVRDRRIATRVGIEAAVAQGVRAVRRLDAIVGNRLRGDAASVAVWRDVRRVGYPARARRTMTPATPPGASPSTPSTPSTTIPAAGA